MSSFSIATDEAPALPPLLSALVLVTAARVLSVGACESAGRIPVRTWFTARAREGGGVTWET